MYNVYFDMWICARAVVIVW